MYASVRHYRQRAGSLEALMHRVDGEFAPAIAQEPGFVCYFVLRTGEDTLESISVFHDADSATRSNQLAAEYVEENLDDFALERTDVVAGEVLVSRAAPEVFEDAHRWSGLGARVRAAT